MSRLQENFLNPSRITDDLVSKLQALSITGIAVEAVLLVQGAQLPET